MKERTIRRITNLMLPLLVILAMTAFLVSQIARFEAYAIDGEEEVIAVEEVQEEEVVKPTTPLDEPEVLLDNYIEIISEEYTKKLDTVSFEAKDGIVPSRLRGAKLTGADKKAYDLLKDKIEEVACGDNSDGLTTFEISFKDIYSNIYSEEFLETSYSANDLGVSAVWVLGDDGNYHITEAAQQKMINKFPLNYTKVINALLYDCPYTLFWYDKTVGVAYGPWAHFEAVETNGEIGVRCNINESVHCFYFAVSTDYCPTDNQLEVYEFDKKIAPIQTDRARIKTLNEAINNAVNVVVEGAKTKEGTYEKLDYYREWICAAVSYDDDAPEKHDKGEIGYGDPWQLINAFDNNPNTNIVCEGYAKAFKYLCDLTENLDADCRIVTGNMGGGKGAGGHMWNVVEIGEKNYLVDVTNCDAGTIGAPKALFMVGAPETSENSDAYIFGIESQNISFLYDDKTKTIYSREERLLATSNYDPNSQSGSGQGEDPGTGTEPGTNPDPKPEPEPEPIDIADVVGVGSVPNQTYTGSAIAPKVIIPDFKEGTDYTVSYKNNINVGTATITVTGIGNYKGSINTNFKILAKPISKLGVSLSATDYTYDGGVKTPGVVVRDGSKLLRNGTDYTVSYAGGRKELGTYRVTVTMKGNYSGSKGIDFRINPKPATIAGPKAAKKAVTVKWKKQTAKMTGKKQITGYQVQVSPVRTFASGVKTKNVKGVKKTSVKIGGLKPKTIYYVRVRTYINIGGRTYWSNWSGIKAVKSK